MTHPISEKKLDVAALLEGTTPGPWRADDDNVFSGHACQPRHIAACNPRHVHKWGEACANARLAASAPHLAAEHIALTKKVDELEAALRWIASQTEMLDRELATVGVSDLACSLVSDIHANADLSLNDTTQCRESNA
ncbi:hypothetical protein SH584_11325 [Sphingomonas sp. LY29]|uniref:hypothetical protein n=1 Tax=Sphingomonas sp. LY29 TaxID=3095341 RepID=UPI002D786071|nr:hypothetical protein [Sphingomonas sp. LY29]WRP25622.1 hypothetical protein SH584_11325 [Sphingomonas sp. LY29]